MTRKPLASISIEPYPTPNLIEQNLHDLLESVGFVDRIIFGRTNYSKEVSAYTAHKHFYNKCAAEVVQFCQERNISYHIKEKTITEESSPEKDTGGKNAWLL